MEEHKPYEDLLDKTRKTVNIGLAIGTLGSYTALMTLIGSQTVRYNTEYTDESFLEQEPEEPSIEPASEKGYLRGLYRAVSEPYRNIQRHYIRNMDGYTELSDIEERHSNEDLAQVSKLLD